MSFPFVKPLVDLFGLSSLRQGAFSTIDAAGARWHRRTVYFPDSSIRDEEATWLGSFDPFSLKYTTNVDPSSADVSDLLLRGKFEEAGEAARDAVRWLSPAKRTQYLLEVTTGVHEIRHFHDAFGTTAGFRRLLQTVRDAAEFSGVIEQLKEQKVIKLPLLKWGRQDDAPTVLKSYVESRRKFAEWLHYQDADLAPIAMPHEFEADYASTIFAIGGVQFTLPSVPRRVKDAATGQAGIRLSPLGGLPIIEGNAFLVQRKVAAALLGKKYKDELWIYARQGSFSDNYWLHYTTIDAYLTRRLQAFYDRFQMIFSDLAMMPEEHDDDHHTHPGWRLELIVAAARGLGKQYEQKGVDGAEYMDKITAELGWPSMQEVTRRAACEAEDKLKQFDLPEGKKGFWSPILAALYRSHLFFLKSRERVAEVMGEPDLYLGITGTWFGLLPPPAMLEKGKLIFRGVTQDDSAAFRNWFFFEHMQRQLLFSSRLPCVVHDLPHDCPGDPIGKPNWSPASTCPFSRFLELTGIAEMDIETLS